MPATLPDLPFRLHTGAWNDPGLVVSEFTFSERLSRPFALDAIALVPEPVALSDLPALGQPATFAVVSEDAEDRPTRLVHGVITRVGHEGTAYDRGGAWLKLRLSPRLWLLKHSRHRRVFQQRNVLQVIDAVLGTHSVPWRWTLEVTPPPMGYCIQHDETDYAFVHRLLARFGLFYYFEHARAEPGSVDAVETMVVCDTARNYPALGPDGATEPLVLKLIDRTGTYRPELSIFSFTYARRARPTSVKLRDWDYRNPDAFPESIESVTDESLLGTDTLQIDDFEYLNASDGNRARRRDARVAIEQRRRDTSLGSGSSDCATFSPGYRFTLNNHDVAHLNVAWALTEVVHEGKVPEYARGARPRQGEPRPPAVYTNRFACAPATVAVRPPRPKVRRALTTETAVVVGPQGEEIFTDEFGRIKVQFLWDRVGTYTETSSCWMRVMQPWAGEGWGFQFVPRIGMEVLVSFVDGDPDRPVVIGCLYNARRMPTHALPATRTRSGIRTQSSPGGGGYNELSFEDSAQEEQIYVHAQRDLDETVRRNHTVNVGADEHVQVSANRTDRVGADRIETVGGNSSETVQRNRVERVGADLAVSVTGDSNIDIEGNRVDVVRRNAEERVTLNRTTRVDGLERATYSRATTEVQNEAVARIEGSAVAIVGTPGAPRALAVVVEGGTQLSSTTNTRISADGSIELRCGTSSIRMLPDHIEIKADTLVTRGKNVVCTFDDGHAKLLANTDVLVKTDTIGLKSSGAIIKLDSDAKIDGGTVKLKSSDSVSIDDSQQTTQPTTVVLVDQNGTALANQRFVITLADHGEIAGNTDASGSAVVDLAADAHIEFPDLGAMGDATSVPPSVPYVVQQGDYLSQLAFRMGFVADDVWHHSMNQTLREQRDNPEVLAPGDVLYVPATPRRSLQLPAGGQHQFTANIPTTQVTIRFRDPAGHAVAGKSYQVVGALEPISGSTSDQGEATFAVPIHLREVQVVFADGATVRVHVGHMDPIRTPSGALKRLRQLGYRPLACFSPLEMLRVMILQFQADQQIPTSGEIDDRTASALVAAHGS